MDTKKIALITGGTSGIGLAIAKTLALQQVKIIIIGRTKKVLEQTVTEINSLAECQGILLNLQHIDTIENIIKMHLKSLSQLDFLFNCAGTAWFGPLESLNYKIVREVFYVNTFAPLLVLNSTLPWLKRSRKPTVVNISSDQSITHTEYNSLYGASKNAVNYYTKSLNLELNKHNIRIFTFAPGPVKTKMLRHVLDTLNIKEFPAEAVSANDIANFIIKYIGEENQENLIFTSKELIHG